MMSLTSGIDASCEKVAKDLENIGKVRIFALKLQRSEL